MTPKEKAQDLVNKITDTIFESGNTVTKPMVKEIARLFVDETKSDELGIMPAQWMHDYWNKVLTELEKL